MIMETMLNTENGKDETHVFGVPEKGKRKIIFKEMPYKFP